MTTIHNLKQTINNAVKIVLAGFPDTARGG